MISVLAGIRYAFFALYIICSGVLITAAAWHLGLASTIGASAQVDAYIIFMGAFGLLFVLAVTFIDTLRKYAVTSCVWFELSWVGLFWVFYLAAASAVTAIGPPAFCIVPTVNPLGWRDACRAVKVIMAFTWLGTMFFLMHLFTLLVLSLLHAPQSPGIWYSGVRDFPWFDFTVRPSFRNSVSANGGLRMGSEPSSPTKYHYERRMAPQPGAIPVSMQPPVVAPIYAKMTSRAVYPSQAPEQHYPTHPFAAVSVPQPAPVHRSGSSRPYQYKPERDPDTKTQSQAIVEQFRAKQRTGSDASAQTSSRTTPGQLQSSIVRALPKLPTTEVASPRPRRANAGLTEERVMGATSQPIRQLPETRGSSNHSHQSSQSHSLYPLHVQSAMDRTLTSTTASYPNEPRPLGDWPRRNPPADPRRVRNPPPPAFRSLERNLPPIPSAGPMSASGAQERVARRKDSAGSTGSSVDSDGVPRTRDGRPKRRPPPLDFSRLNAGRQ